eukprot:4967326-Karenia_brevis.AAC.1
MEAARQPPRPIDLLSLLVVVAQAPKTRINMTIMLPRDTQWWETLTQSYKNNEFTMTGSKLAT